MERGENTYMGFFFLLLSRLGSASIFLFGDLLLLLFPIPFSFPSSMLFTHNDSDALFAHSTSNCVMSIKVPALIETSSITLVPMCYGPMTMIS